MGMFLTKEEELESRIDRLEKQLRYLCSVLANTNTRERQLTIPDVSNRRELLLAYHEFYLKWRGSVSNSNPEYAVDAFLSKQ